MGNFQKRKFREICGFARIIKALHVAKHYWLSETAKCGDCAAWRFSNSAKVRNPQSVGFSKSATSEFPKAGNSRKRQCRGIRGFARLKKLYKGLSAIDFQKLQSARIVRCGDSQILQSQKPRKLWMLKNAIVGESADLRVYKIFASGGFSNAAKSEPPKVGNSKNANVGESTDFPDYKSSTSG